MKTFYLVWNPDSGAPKIKHDTLDLARAEAERLAQAHRGQPLYVLKAVACCKTATVVWEQCEEAGDDPDAPF